MFWLYQFSLLPQFLQESWRLIWVMIFSFSYFSAKFSVCTTKPISSVAQSCLTLCDTMNCSTPGLPVHHQLPEFTQTHVHWAGNAIQPSHLLLSPLLPAPNPSKHQSLFQWVNSSHDVSNILMSFLGSSDGKDSAYNVGDLGSIPGLINFHYNTIMINNFIN